MKQTSAEHFLAACGADQPLRVAVSRAGEPNVENWVFPRPFLVIGRRADSDLVLDHWQISRRHAYLQFLDGGFFCVDLASRTGTHGGDSTERSGWVPRGLTIQVGPYEVRPTWPTRPPGPSAGAAEELPGVVWELPGRAIGRAVWRMDPQLVLVGRSPSCKIRLVERDVSKFHCSLVRTRMGVWVVDLLGQHGVFVNDEPVRCARLDDGDELRVGRHVLRPRYDAPPPRPIGDIPPASAAARDPDGPGVANLPATLGDLPGPSAPARLVVPAPAMPPAGVNLAAILEEQGRSVDPVMSAMVRQFGQMQQQMFEQFHQTMMAMFEGFAAMHREQSDSMRDEIEQVRRLSREIEALQAETERLRGRSVPGEAGAGPDAPPAPDPLASPPGWPPTPPVIPPIGKPKKTIAGGHEAEGDIHEQLVRRLASIHSERQGRWQKILGMMSTRS